MARESQAEVSEHWWRPEFERRLQEVLREPGYGFVGVRIANHEVTFVEFSGQTKKSETPQNSP